MKPKEKQCLDFYKTDLGRVMKIVEIIGCILIIIGFFLAILQAFIHANDLSDKYQSIIEFGDSAIIYGLICLLANKTAQNDYYLKNKK